MTRRLWTKEEEIVVFNLYCKIPFKSSSKFHPDVIRIANIIGRTPSAVNMKIGNFGRLDPNLKNKNISGLTNGSKLDEEVWNEFNNNWDKLAYESEQLIAKYENNTVLEEDNIPSGKERITSIKQRVNQNFFRKAVLSSYNCCCCITGLSNPELLIASHIKPWRSSNENEKTNPTNGLCLNALHDKAFDKGFLTVDENYFIHISSEIKDCFNGETVERYFKYYDNKKIALPDRFMPNKKFLIYHYDTIYENWKKTSVNQCPISFN